MSSWSSDDLGVVSWNSPAPAADAPVPVQPARAAGWEHHLVEPPAPAAAVQHDGQHDGQQRWALASVLEDDAPVVPVQAAPPAPVRGQADPDDDEAGLDITAAVRSPGA